MDALRARWNTEMKGVPKSEWNTPENSEKWQKMYQEMRDSPENKKRQAESKQLDKDLRKYVTTDRSRKEDADVPHGFVWLFRRK